MFAKQLVRLIVLSALFVLLQFSMTAASAAPASGKRPVIYVIQGSTGSFSNALVSLDGKFLRSLKPNNYLAVSVIPGAHIVSTAGTGSLAFPITARSGETYYVQQEIDDKGMPRLFLLSETEGRRTLEASNATGGMIVAETQAPSETGTSTRRRYNGSGETDFSTNLKGYIGLGAGQSKVRGLKDEAVSLGLDDVKDTDTAFKVFAGYRFTDTLALEAVYTNLGTFKATDGTTTLSWKASGFGIAGVGTVPVTNQLALLGKAGVFHWNLDTAFTGSVSDKASGSSAFYGLGLAYAISDTSWLRAEYERYAHVGKEDVTGQDDIDLLSLSVLFNF